jgi:hypothetical protein
MAGEKERVGTPGLHFTTQPQVQFEKELPHEPGTINTPSKLDMVFVKFSAETRLDSSFL